MSLALVMPGRETGELADRLARRLPGVPVQVWPALTRPGDVILAVLWKQPPGALAELPALRALMSFGAGVDFILGDRSIDPALPVARFADPDLGGQVASYVLAHVLARAHRLADFRACQERAEWAGGGPPVRLRVAVLGLGLVGGAVAGAFHRLGHEVTGWARTARPGADWPVETGPAGLVRAVANASHVVAALPATPATRRLLGRALFDALGPDTTLVNVGRGDQLVEADLLAGLAAGRPAAAVLDVFEQEPLPPAHPFWRHPRITVTPHVAGPTDPERAASAIARCYRALAAGKPLPDTVDRRLGY